MLRYSFEQSNDPEREKIYMNLIKDLYGISDKVREKIIINQYLQSIYNKKSPLALPAQFGLGTEMEVLKFIESLFTEAIEESQVPSKFSSLFTYFWFNNSLSADEFNFCTGVFNSQHIPWQYKSVLVSALTISVLRYFDTHKLHLLFNLLENNNQQLWVRAFCGLVFSFSIYNDRIPYYPKISDRMKSLADVAFSSSDLDMVFVQFMKSQDTERITRKIQEEIMPDVMKMQSKLTDKLDLDNITSLEEMHEKNPEWQSVFEESPDLYDKVERISKMQTEGIDVFHSAFSMLKHFPFFNNASNWFLPFYAAHPQLTDTTGEGNESFKDILDQLEKSSLMCNSDKYSFCFNIGMLPEANRNQVLKLFDLELNAMNEIEADDNLLHEQQQRKNIVKQYVQDLYRFYKVFPERKQILDIFNFDVDFEHLKILEFVDVKNQIIRNIGEYYFENENFEIAIQFFEMECRRTNSFEYFEKIGFAYQKLKNYRKALQFYKKSELVNKKSLWLIKKLAVCYKNLGEYDEALYYFQEAESEEKDSLYLLASIAGANMELGNYQEALKTYFKIEYLSPNNTNILRPLAYCSLQLQKLENVVNYLLKIPDAERNEFDYFHLAMAEWATQKTANAISYFVIALKKASKGLSWMVNEFQNESKLMKDLQIAETDIKLMIDYLHFNH
jgi:tetratricopeptide (TPR) repeat protein